MSLVEGTNQGIRHFIPTVRWDKPNSKPYYCGANTDSGTTDQREVNCEDCINLLSRRAEGVVTPTPDSETMKRRAWAVQVVAGETDTSFQEWKYLHGHSNERPPRHTPPYMNDDDNGVFTFHDVHITGCTLEVVPQESGNVEITVDYNGDGHFATLHHLDRMDLVRALLHDFHYSPERGGPNDDA